MKSGSANQRLADIKSETVEIARVMEELHSKSATCEKAIAKTQSALKHSQTQIAEATRGCNDMEGKIAALRREVANLMGVSVGELPPLGDAAAEAEAHVAARAVDSEGAHGDRRRKNASHTPVATKVKKTGMHHKSGKQKRRAHAK